MQRPVRVGVVGLGFGAAVHAPAMLAMPNVELVGLIGRRIEKVEATAERLGLSRDVALTKLDELLARQPDLISIALPPDQIEAVALPVMASGCAVLCEKPLGGDIRVAQRLFDAATVPNAIDFQFSHLPVFTKLKSLIDCGAIGTPRHVSVTWLAESYAQKQKKWSWKTDAHCHGGVMSLLGSHLLFLAEWLMGPALNISAQFDNRASSAFAPDGAEAAEDHAEFRMLHETGATFSATISNSAPGVHRHLWHVMGSEGTLVIANMTKDHMSGFDLSGTGAAGEISWTEQGSSAVDGRLAPFSALLSDFLSTLARSPYVPFYPGFKEGLRVQKLQDAARRSSTSGRITPCI
jgi:predicted dehydrogenase